MKKIKNSLVLIFALVVMGTTVFTSCSKDDASGAKKILMNHKWELNTIETEDENLTAFFDLAYNLVKTTYEFKKDGVLEITSKFLFAEDVETGTWSISDDEKQLTINGETSEIIELTNKVLKMGPNLGILGGTGEDTEDVSGYTDYVLVFDAK